MIARIIDSSVSPVPQLIGASGTTLITQSSDVYTIGPDQIVRVWNVSGSVSPNAAGDEGALTVTAAQIVAELYGDLGASQFIGDLVLAVLPFLGGPMPLAGAPGASLRSDFHDRPIVEIHGQTVVGDASATGTKTPQSVLFILQASVTNSTAVAKDVNADLVVMLSVEQQGATDR